MALIPRLLKPGMGAAAWATVAASAGRTAWRLSRSALYARRAVGYEQQPQPALALRLLVVGDGTALGSGASAPERSLAGLIGRDHPLLAIENRAVAGARFQDVADQLRAAGGPYDLVLVQAGGNDVIRPAPRDELEADVERVVRRARELAPLVVLLPGAHLGRAPFFAPPVAWWVDRRSRRLQQVVAAVAKRHGAHAVDFHGGPHDDAFVRDPARFFAGDGLHPNDAGYAGWWQELQRGLPLAEWLRAAR